MVKKIQWTKKNHGCTPTTIDLFYFSVCKIFFKSNFCCISSPFEPWKAWTRKDALNQLKILMNKQGHVSGPLPFNYYYFITKA